jgi:hypothetical protein
MLQQPPSQQQPLQAPTQQQQQFQRLTPADGNQDAGLASQSQAAAGMPPLNRPNAAMIANSTPAPQAQGVPTRAEQPQNQYMPGQAHSQQSTYALQQQQRMMQGPNAAQQRPASSQQSPPPQQQQRVSSNGGGNGGGSITAAPPQPIKKTRENSNPTSAPTIQESRVSFSANGAHRAPLVGPRIQQLVAELDPNYTLDAQAEEQLLTLADDFLDKVCASSLKLAKHRGSSVLDVQDVQMVLQKQWKINIPGLPPLPSVLPLSTKVMSGSAVSSNSKQTGSSNGGGSGARRKETRAPSAKLAKTGTGDVKSQT